MTDGSDKVLTYAEVDYDFCRLRYGEFNGIAQCQASLGTTGEEKCFNTRRTCQDPANYTPGTKTLRFHKPSGFEPKSIDSIPSVSSVDTAPARLRPGEDLGERESVTVRFRDHPYHDRTTDPYVDERLSGAARADGVGYDPAEQGTYWGKWRARNPYFQNRGLRIIQGAVGQEEPARGFWALRNQQGLNQDFYGPLNNELRGLVLKPDGSKAYTFHQGETKVIEYSLATPYDISTASRTSNDLSTTFQLEGITIENGGQKLVATVDSGNIRQWTLSTPWDLSTATVGVAFDATGQMSTSKSVALTTLGDIMLVSDQTTIYRYDLSTSFDVSSASFSGTSKQITATAAYVRFTLGRDDDMLSVTYVEVGADHIPYVEHYLLADAGDISGGYLRSRTALGPKSSLETERTGIEHSSDGQYLYITSGNVVYSDEPAATAFIAVVDMYSLVKSFPNMETRHYIMEETSGPDSDGTFSITAKDVLKLADDDRAQAPRASDGQLDGDITASATSATLKPTGIGSDYPASGKAVIGNEVIAYTRSDDSLTLTRAQYGTAAEDHADGDTVQVAIEYQSDRASDIILDLLTNYADVPPGFINLDAWRTEDDQYINRLYGALIAEPTGVRELVGQLCQQVGFTVWWDPVAQLIRFKAIRQPSVSPRTLTDESDFLAGSIQIKEQPKERISQVWVYYGVIDPTEDLEEARNYRAVAIKVDADAEGENQYQSPKIEKIYARWITQFNRPAAEDMANRLLSRYRNAPRKLTFDLPRREDASREQLMVNQPYDVLTRLIQAPSGQRQRVRVIATSFERGTEMNTAEVEEFNYDESQLPDIHIIPVDATTTSQEDGSPLNLREMHDQIRPSVSSGDKVELRVAEEAVIGAQNTDLPAIDIGDWPSGVDITVVLMGRVEGAGGQGGESDNYDGSGSGGDPGQQGGVAIFTRYPITIDSTGGIWGGGGGGGSGGERAAVLLAYAYGGAGGGGAGFVPGAKGVNTNDQEDDTPKAQPGTRTSGGEGGSGETTIYRGGVNNDPQFANGGDGGRGGNPGEQGESGEQSSTSEFGGGGITNGGPGGQPGAAIDGVSYVTFTNEGYIRGPQIN